jgi:hypothetical protein
MRTVHGVCWRRTGTVGNIAVADDVLHGEFPSSHGHDARLACELVPAGKYRNGAPRAWCRSHQTYWGVNADLAALAHTGLRRCSLHAEAMSYALDVPVIDVQRHAGVVIRCAGTDSLKVNVLAEKTAALAIDVAGAGVFTAPDITRVHITPPAVAAYVEARRSGNALGCVHCAKCGHPHLDLGDFALTLHRRHYCGHCGNDSTHSPTAIISSPLHALCMAYGPRLSFC